jgi:hypothetical protein
MISAQPTSNQKNLSKREIKGVAVGTQLHHLQKKIEGSSKGMSNFPNIFI